MGVNTLPSTYACGEIFSNYRHRTKDQWDCVRMWQAEWRAQGSHEELGTCAGHKLVRYHEVSSQRRTFSSIADSQCYRFHPASIIYIFFFGGKTIRMIILS